MSFSRDLYVGTSDWRSMSRMSHAAPDANLHLMDLPYRLSSWALDDAQNVAFWRDATGQLVAWAVLQTPFWTMDFAHLPTSDTTSLYPLMLAWADERARAIVNTPGGHLAWFVNVRDDQHARIAALEAAGFACQENAMPNPWSKMFLMRSAQQPIVECALLDGITIRSLVEEKEVDAYVQLHRNAFGSASMTREWRYRTLQWPEYRADTDLVAVDTAENLIAFCIGWFDDAGWGGRPCGQIEPMGVREDFQHRGLGRAILSECLLRLYQAGAERVYVEADGPASGATGFYQSVGFAPLHNVLVYRKDYAAFP